MMEKVLAVAVVTILIIIAGCAKTEQKPPTTYRVEPGSPSQYPATVYEIYPGVVSQSGSTLTNAPGADRFRTKQSRLCDLRAGPAGACGSECPSRANPGPSAAATGWYLHHNNSKPLSFNNRLRSEWRLFRSHLRLIMSGSTATGVGTAVGSGFQAAGPTRRGPMLFGWEVHGVHGHHGWNWHAGHWRINSPILGPSRAKPTFKS